MRRLSLIFFSLCSMSFVAQASASNINFLTISDIHYNHLAKAVTYGEDTGKTLMQKTWLKISSVIKKTQPKFILFLGDLPAHRAEYNNRLIDDTYVLQHLRKIAGKKIPLFFTMGNNDSLSGDYHSFSNKKGVSVLSLDPHHGWPGINALKHCEKSSTKACLISLPYHLKYGFYSAYPLGVDKHLRLIVLNSIAFSLYYKSSDGIQQKQIAQLELNWLSKQLATASSKNESIIIAMHIPPGQSSYSHAPMWNSDITLQNNLTIQDTFLSLIKRYHSRIKAILAAHTHFDQTRLLYNHSKQFIGAVTFTPGITPQHGNNPGFKTYYYNPKIFNLITSTTYYTTPSAQIWGKATYSSESNNLATLSKNKVIQLVNAQYAVKRTNYKPPQGWQAIDNAIFLQMNDHRQHP